jgi:hypothetical protein
MNPTQDLRGSEPPLNPEEIILHLKAQLDCYRRLEAERDKLDANDNLYPPQLLARLLFYLIKDGKRWLFIL